MGGGEKIKVITITTSGLARKEGISTVILDYYGKLDRTKYDLQIVASGEYCYELVRAFQKIGVKIRCLPSRKATPNDYYKAFIKLFKEERYDVIYIHGSSAIMAVEFMIAKLFGCKVMIAHSHNTMCNHPKMDKLLRPLFYNLLTKGLACGNEAGKWLYGDHSFTVISNGRDPGIYHFESEIRNKMRVELGLKDDVLAIGHVGNFNAQKNQAFLIDVFKMIQTKMPEAKLFLMGDGIGCNDVIKKVKANNLMQSVVFTGSINNIPEMLQAMDVMVLPSLYEGLPLVVVEWQMCGLPCLISNRVTKECAFSDLVYFADLDDSKEQWAETVLSIANVDRELESQKSIVKAKEAGFDINIDVAILDAALSGRR